MKPQKTVLVGVAGASGSGKSFFCDKLRASVTNKSVIVLSQDYYYKDHSHIPLQQRHELNYDHPDAIDFKLLIEDLQALKQGRSITHPIYDFTVHNRKSNSAVVAGPAEVVIVDGILIYAVQECRAMFDYKVFIDTPLDLCLIRRMCRDIQERGRSIESVVQQYLKTVRPMLLENVIPTKHVADLVVEGVGTMQKGIHESIREINNKMEQL